MLFINLLMLTDYEDNEQRSVDEDQKIYIHVR